MLEGGVDFWFHIAEARDVDIAACCSALRSGARAATTVNQGGRWLTQQQLSKAVKSADVIDQQQQQELFRAAEKQFWLPLWA